MAKSSKFAAEVWPVSVVDSLVRTWVELPVPPSRLIVCAILIISKKNLALQTQPIYLYTHTENNDHFILHFKTI